MWTYLDDRRKEEAHRDMEEEGLDKNTLGDSRCRKHFDTDLMDTVRDRDMTWNEAKRHGHEIFYHPGDEEGKKKHVRPNTSP
jgi:hypothetical protein